MTDRYTHGHHESVLRSHRWRTADNSAAYLVDRLGPGMTLLDVGCGPGTLTADLARRVAPGRVVAVDRSRQVLEKAATATARLDNVELLVGDVYQLAFPSDSFDVIHAHQVLQHLARPVEALREMARICRPDGVVAVRDAVYRAMTWSPREPVLDRWMEIYQAVARANGAEPDAGRYLLDWAGAAGLVDVVASTSAWVYASPGDRRWWGDLWAERIVSSDLARQVVAHGVADEEELTRISDGWRRWAASPQGWFVIVHGEVVGRPG